MHDFYVCDCVSVLRSIGRRVGKVPALLFPLLPVQAFASRLLLAGGGPPGGVGGKVMAEGCALQLFSN